MRIILIVLTLAAILPAYAQEGMIVANPAAVTLREIWRIRGAAAGGDQVGDGIGGGFDVNGDGIGDFAVRFGKLSTWRVYLGGSPTPGYSAIWSFKSTGELRYLATGDFWNTGHQAIAAPKDTCFINEHGATVCYFRLWIFRTETGTVSDTPATIISTLVQPCIDALVTNLDGGGDDLILAYNCYRPELWIYRGGSDFGIGEPTIKVIDTTEKVQADRFHVVAGDFDGDAKQDLMTAETYRNGSKIKLYFGSETAPLSWTKPDRVINLSADRHPDIGYGLTTLDADGDSITDLLLPGPGRRVYLFRSRGTGKNARSRNYDVVDADNSYHTGGFLVPAGPGAPLNDGTGRYDMMVLVDNKLMTFSGGPFGPDSAYEATYRDGQGNAFALTRSIGDVNGDGWSDYMTANFSWWGLDQGVALILAGGPYIPRDDTTLTVSDIPSEDRADAISVWPNPVQEVLNIAWRGDLRRPPHRFDIYDVLGRRIATGNLHSPVGAVQWRSDNAVPGAYFLSVYDDKDGLIATTCFLVQH